MLLKRSWAKDIEIDDVWGNSCKLAKHRTYIYWSHPGIALTDEKGFIIPAGFSSFQEKFEKSKNLRKIFCFGGSTTFGAFGNYSESYPCHLEKCLMNTAVFNIGLGGFDIAGLLYLLIDLLRWGFVPDLAIFLSGVNEKQAWYQATNGYARYEETSHQYGYFKDLVSFYYYGHGKKKILGPWAYIKKLLLKASTHNNDAEINNNPFRFVVDHAESHVRTVKTINKIAKAWNIDTKFFLQPILWDFWKAETDQGNLSRYKYIKLLYQNILAKSYDKIIDLSGSVPLKPEMFSDWQHINSDGNKLLAQSIYKEIKKQW